MEPVIDIDESIGNRVIKGRRKMGKGIIEEREEGRGQEMQQVGESQPRQTLPTPLSCWSKATHWRFLPSSVENSSHPPGPTSASESPPPLHAGHRTQVRDLTKQSSQPTLAESSCWPRSFTPISISNRPPPCNLFIYSFSLPRFP